MLPDLPMTYAELEQRARNVLSPSLWSYIAGGAGDERTQDVNATAFDGWGLVPRMLVGATERDLSVELFGKRWEAPVFLAPIGVIGLCAQDGHGDLETARAAGRNAFHVFSDATLHEIASRRPQTMDELAAIKGVGPKKLQQYGPAILAMTQAAQPTEEKRA